MKTTFLAVGALCAATFGTALMATDYGNDSSEWAMDGECDDPRFEGPGMADVLLAEDAYADATDCMQLEAQGLVWPRGSVAPAPTKGGSCSGIDFGDDASMWANDGECDDPRFAGPGAAETLLAEDAFHDASDCRQACASGAIWPR